MDGVKDTHFSKCTRTDLNGKGTINPWWRVNLEQWLPVSEVYILNRGDCCGDRLKGFEIRVGKFDESREVTVSLINTCIPNKRFID